MRRKSLLATLSLIALFGFAPVADALNTPSLLPEPAAVAIAATEEEAEIEAEASEDEEFEMEECIEDEEEECVEEEGRGRSVAPPECLLSSAEPVVTAASNRDRVRLQIRYETAAPATATVAYGLHGANGALFLGSEKQRLGRKGVLRLDRDLTEAQMAKVAAAKDFTVRIRVAAAPGWCQPLFERQLDLRRATPSGFSWAPSE